MNFAFLCDYADQSGGKLGAFGIGIDIIYAPKMPATHRLFFAVISIRFSSTETGTKQVGIRLIDADGKDVVPPLDTTINVTSPPPGFLHKDQRLALGMHNVAFPAYGDYSVRWLVSGQEVKNIPLRVAPPPTPPTTA